MEGRFSLEIPVEEGKGVIKLESLPTDWKKVVRVLERELRKARTTDDVLKYYQVNLWDFQLLDWVHFQS